MRIKIQNCYILTKYWTTHTILVIFNWIKFRNDVCHAKNYNTEHHEYDEDGVCYTSEECSSRGGLHKANCAAGYGACCVCKNISNLTCIGFTSLYSLVRSNISWYLHENHFIVRASGNGESNEKVAYFSNPSFPFKDNLTNYLTYTIKASLAYTSFLIYK